MASMGLDIDTALGALRQLLGETDAQGARHRSNTPDFPAAAAGRGFHGHGEAVSEMLRDLHASGRNRIEVLQSVAAAAGREVHRVGEVEQDFSAALSRGGAL